MTIDKNHILNKIFNIEETVPHENDFVYIFFTLFHKFVFETCEIYLEDYYNEYNNLLNLFDNENQTKCIEFSLNTEQIQYLKENFERFSEILLTEEEFEELKKIAKF